MKASLDSAASGVGGAPDCQRCGVCCFSNEPEYVGVWGIDCARLGELTQEYTQVIGDRRFMRMQGGHCAALVIDVRERRLFCGIYAFRPDICRSLMPESSACLAAIREKGCLGDELLRSAAELSDSGLELSTSGGPKPGR